MLRLEKLEMRGFKSFCDRTDVRFPKGITAIVGPNGCGKSNIGDAINWVLGERSAKMLRGQQMADVIFGGSEARKAVGMAEVSLTFSGAEGLQGSEQGSLVITRRLFRSGESDYLTNGSRARLKDIQEVLRAANVGARTYATIEQGKIDQVLNAKPKDRRALIEDAAGISGYKHKRRLSELKLEATYANLLRVNDIVTEVQRQINSLKRQAAKARRYRKLREDLRDKELIRFSHHASKLEQELVGLARAEADARDAESESAARLAGLEADLVERREELEKLDREFREHSEGLHQRDIEIDREEVQIRTCRERIAESEQRAARRRDEIEAVGARRDGAGERLREVQSTVAQWAGELEAVSTELADQQTALDEAEGRQRTLRDEIERLRREQFESMSGAAELRNELRGTEEALERCGMRRSRLEAEQASAQHDLLASRNEASQLAEALEVRRGEVEGRREALERQDAELARAREQHTADLESLAQAREREKAVAGRLATLEALETRFAGVSDGVKTLLGPRSKNGIRTCGVVADYIEASRDVEGVVEGYLQALLPTVILEDDGDARMAADFLRSEGAGRTSLVCRSQPAGALAVGMSGNGTGQIPAAVLEDQRVVGRLRDKMKLKASANGVVSSRIGDAVIVDTLETALDLHRRYPTVDYLTSAGEVVYASGVIAAGGQRAAEQGLLAHSRHVQESRREGEEAAQAIATLQQRVERGREALVQADVDLRQGRQELETVERLFVELQSKVERSSEETERGSRRSELLAEELAAAIAELEPLQQSLQRLLGDRQRLEEAHGDLERRLEQANENGATTEAEIKQRAEQVADLRAQQAAMRQRQSGVEQERLRIEQELAEIEARLGALNQEVADAEQVRSESTELLGRTEADLVRHLEQREALLAESKQREADLAARREKLAAADGALRELRSELEARREATRVAELERTRVQASREHLDDLCRQELGVAAAEARPPEGAEDQPVDLEALEVEVEDLKRRIEGIGPVNMTAIEEFSDLEQRHGFLTAQREDLERSMESLRETIRKINRQSRTRFTEAFEAIRKSYQEVYQLLFAGGRADLRLEEGDDVLECGIEILAQPPGKRLTGVHLLSGGEKALSALALLFAIFHWQPSPFCLLDEVDAALDESNVARFIRLVTEYSSRTQFIVVTHNKLSMEAADLLCGVTMEEPGVSKVMSLQVTA